ncbi:MAG: type I-G CRISPR-associated helicase/endonuclease Cas3g [Sciscionella sp.]
MTLQRENFAAFFAEVHDGHKPFRWQERLLDQVLTGRWPDRISAPTGAGKTAVIDVHVFAVALMAAGATTVRVPRRLALVVARRALVDDQHVHARSLACRLKKASGNSVLAQVAGALRTLYLGHPKHDSEIDPLVTGSLRGGLPPSRAWRDDPVACAVINATPDMWGSRVLLRGYGSSRYARPREAGLLAHDAVVVVDEAHLSRQLLCTARRIAELQECAEEELAVPTLQVVETTATPSTAIGTTVGVEVADLDPDPELAQRLCVAKPVRLIPLPTWPLPDKGAGRRAGIREIAGAARRLHAEFGATVGCLVNTVGVAVDVAKELRDAGLTVELLCGRLRPHDVTELRTKKWPELLTVTGNPQVDVLVATQTLEVGVDLDLHAMVTELAPGTALAQRAGRVNRLGRRATAIEVVVPSDPTSMKMVKPYEVDDLQEALTWLAKRATDEQGLAPWALRDAVAPPPAVRRVPEAQVPASDTWQFLRLELWDTWQLARTSDELIAEPDLDLWLADDLEPDRDVGLLVRSGLDPNATAAVEMLHTLPPRRHEVFPTPIPVARKVLDKLLQPNDSEISRVVLRIRNGDVDLLETLNDLRPGDVFVVDSTCPVFRAGVVDEVGAEQVIDVLESVEPESGDLALVLDEWRVGSAPVAAAAAAFEEPTQRLARHGLTSVVEGLAHRATGQRRAWLQKVAGLLRGRIADVDVVIQRWSDSEEQEHHRILIADQRRARRDDEARQTWTSAREPVTLDQHQTAVAERAAAVGTALDLGAELGQALRLAGLHHDDGKDDPRFQAALAAPDDVVLAKSQGLSPAQAKDKFAKSGLPIGWRHEQLSAARCWSALVDCPERELVIRLVGTSHGRGRVGYPHTGAQLCIESAAATDLFDSGYWDEVVERTDRRFGVWGTAYLEALLRAADGQVSGEGS